MATADYPRQALPAGGAPPTAAPSDASAVLQRNLQRLVIRRNQQRMWVSLAGALACASGLCALLVLLYRLYLINGEWYWLLPIVGVALLIGYRNGALRRFGPFDAALDADRTLDLQERLSSAYAFVQPGEVRRRLPAPSRRSLPARALAWVWPGVVYETSAPAHSTGLVPSLVQDAAARSVRLDPKQLYPARLDRATRALLGCSILWVVFAVMPNLEWLRTVEQRRLSGVLQQQGKELELVAKAVHERQDTPRSVETSRLARRLSELGRKLQRGRMTKKVALVEMGQLRKDLERAASHDQQNGGAGMDQVEQALRDQPMETPEGQQMQQELARQDYEKAAQQLEKLADRLEKKDLSAQEREQAANDMEKAAKALRRQGGQQNQRAADQLQQAAQALRRQNQQGGQQQGQQQRQGQQQGQGPPQQGAQQGSQNGANGAGANGLRQMAKGLRRSGTRSGNSQALRDMLNKIAQAEKDTGQNSGSQSGSQGSNAADSDGDSPGTALTPGKDLQPSTTGPLGGAGLGTRHGNQPHGSGGGVSDQKSRRTGDTRRWNDVWSDRLPKTHQKIDRVTGKIGSQGDTEQLETRGEARNGPVKTPYYEVYESYKKDAEDAVAKEVVPPAYKQPVKDYFESLKPQGK